MRIALSAPIANAFRSIASLALSPTFITVIVALDVSLIKIAF